jgi:uncharacterized protein (TIGR02300 family)
VGKEALGIKRQCQSCGAKFYDLNKNPIICPKCDTVFVPMAVSSRLRAAAASSNVVAANDEDLPLDEAVAFVPLEDVVAAEDGDKDIALDDDIELDDDEDDSFLPVEDEDDEDDVADLIDGDLEKDDEN